MNRKKLYNLLLRGWFKTKGRASRQEFVFRFLMMWFFGFVATLFYSVFHNNEDSVLGIFFGLIATFILTPIFVLSVIQEFFLTHRRLHDLNASGWCQLILLIPFGQFLLIGLLFFKGTDGTNKYGDPPKY